MATIKYYKNGLLFAADTRLLPQDGQKIIEELDKQHSDFYSETINRSSMTKANEMMAKAQFEINMYNFQTELYNWQVKAYAKEAEIKLELYKNKIEDYKNKLLKMSI